MSKHPVCGSRGGMVPQALPRIVPPLLTAALALFGAAAPLAAQSARVADDGELIVQNNRDVPVTVFLEMEPFEKRLGEVDAMRTAKFRLPARALRDDRIELYLKPAGQMPLEATGWVSPKTREYALLVPPKLGQELEAPAPVLATETQTPSPTTQHTSSGQEAGGSELDG